MFSTYVFLDFETTGLVNPEVTASSLIAVTDSTSLQNKLVTFHSTTGPITEAAKSLTGLNNSDLRCFQPFVPCGIKLLLSFLAAQSPPVCLVAHNGTNFDFEIIFKALNAASLTFPASVYTVDTLELFREMGFKKCKLVDLHQTLFECKPAVSHDAEQDCITLIKCFFKAECDQYLTTNYKMK